MEASTLVQPNTATGLDTSSDSHAQGRVAELESQLAQARQALLTQQAEMESQQWLDKTLSRFDDVMRANFDRSLQEYSEAILLELGRVLNNVQGALYAVLEDDNQQPYLKVVGGYACNIGQLPKTTYAMGEGLIGQAAKSKERFMLGDIGEHAQAPQSSTLIQVQPQALAILPIVYNDRVKGVLELSLLQPLTPAQADLLQRLCWNLGASMESLLNQVKMQDMYVKSQEAYQQMAAQEEEMRQNLEELEATQEEVARKSSQIEWERSRFASVINGSSDTILVVDRNYRITLMNDQMRRTYTDQGLDVPENANVFDLIPPAEHDKFKADYDKVLNGGERVDIETAFDMGPNRMYVDISYFPVYGLSNEVIGCAVISRDITSRKMAEMDVQQKNEELEAQQEEMRQNLEELQTTQEEMRRVQEQLKVQSGELERIMQNVPGVIYTFQLELDTQKQGFTFVSDKCNEILGYTTEALLADYGTGKLIDLHEDDMPAYIQRITESATQLTQFVWEGRMRRADGNWLWVRAESTPTRLSDTLVSWDGILSDISERKRYEDMLHQKLEEIAQIQQAVADSKAFLDSTINSTEIMFIATDIEGTVKYWNDAAAKQLGYSREEIVDKLSPAVFHVLDEIAAEADRLNALHNAGLKPGFEVFTYIPFKNESYKREWTYVDKSGRQFPVELAISAWRKGDGSIGGLLGIAQDITQRKQQEELVRVKTEELAANEEEMRQNLEELQATQEEMRRAQRVLEKIKREQEEEIARLNEQHNAALREVETKKAEAELALKEAQKREKQIETQQKVMMQAIDKFKQKEQDYKARIAELEKVASN